MSEWRPIESAPKDGRSLWLYCPNDEPAQVQGHYECDESPCSYWAADEMLVNDVVGSIDPTHWMPLPEPPKERE